LLAFARGKLGDLRREGGNGSTDENWQDEIIWIKKDA